MAQVADSDWIEWTGGECPVPSDTPVEVSFRGDAIDQGDASQFEWAHKPDCCDGVADIIAYQACEPRKWRTGPDHPPVEARHKRAAAWALDRAPDSATWEYLTAHFRTPDQIWQANRVAEAFARFEADVLAYRVVSK